LARIAVSAAAQKRQYLRRLPDSSALKRRFLIERAAAAIVPRGLDHAVQLIAAEGAAFEFALEIVQTLKGALQKSGRAINLDLRLDLPADACVPAHDERSLELAGKLHECAGAGAVIFRVQNGDADALVDVLQQAWQTTAVARLQLQRAEPNVQQGEFGLS
jgi:hypothetical protein